MPAFDTGDTVPQRTRLRSAIVQLLSGLLRPTGYLSAVVPWGGVVRGWQDGDGIDEIQRVLNGRAPAIAVACGDSITNPTGMGGFNYKADIELTLYHYSNHVRSITEGRVSSDARALATPSADPGLDVMLEHAEELIGGLRVGKAAPTTNPVGEIDRALKGIHLITPTRTEELATTSDQTIWAQRFTVQVTRQFNRFRTVTQLLEELATTLRPQVETVDSNVPAVQFGNDVP